MPCVVAQHARSTGARACCSAPATVERCRNPQGRRRQRRRPAPTGHGAGKHRGKSGRQGETTGSTERDANGRTNADKAAGLVTAWSFTPLDQHRQLHSAWILPREVFCGEGCYIVCLAELCAPKHAFPLSQCAYVLASCLSAS
jgi:hypothetical protein